MTEKDLDTAPHRPFATIAVLAALALLIGIGFARAATPAEGFIQDNVRKGLAILNDKAITADARRSQFRSFLETLTDVHRIAMFTLGDAGKTASPEDVDSFVDAFRHYAAAVYQQQLAHYSGQSLTVTGSIERAPGDYIVRSVISQPTGSRSADADEVDFRVEDDGGKPAVVDASVMGVWLGVEERDQFAAFLSQHGNDVKALAADLERRSADIGGAN